mmetsp:Transcript_13720/g.28343  ORF Transcript_13720/g.28343 Transcript_13720/m.28343 type:complete len:210 (-) Transcript_13720:710-1339(-)
MLVACGISSSPTYCVHCHFKIESLHHTSQSHREFLDSFPGKVGIVSSKVTIGSSFSQNGTTQVEVPNDAARSQVEILVDHSRQLSICHPLLDSSVRIDIYRQGIGDANGIGQLNQRTLAQFGSHQRLCDPASSISSRSINLGGILTRKGTSPMSAPATIGINNDLSSRQSSVAMRTANDEPTRRIQMVNRLLVQVLLRNHRFDNVFHQI